MEINYLKDIKRCEIWLTREEVGDGVLKSSLAPICAGNRDKGIMTVIYESGKGDLYTTMVELLRYNRKRSAEKEAIAQ